MPPETNKSRTGLIVTIIVIAAIILAAAYFWNGESAGSPTGGSADETASIESELQGLELESIGEDLELI
jgi:flagellar basal body-associated protein FliL